MNKRCFANMGSCGREYTVLELMPYDDGQIILAVRVPMNTSSLATPWDGQQRDIHLDREQASELGHLLLNFARGEEDTPKPEPKSWDCDR